MRAFFRAVWTNNPSVFIVKVKTYIKLDMGKSNLKEQNCFENIGLEIGILSKLIFHRLVPQKGFTCN